MDPWVPLNSNSSDSDSAKTAHISLTTILPECCERKTMGSAEYLSIIGKAVQETQPTYRSVCV